MDNFHQSSRPRITGIIHTRNEERNIAQAIRSLTGFVDEILIADMNSSDRTVEIATSMGARVIQVPEFGYVEPARPIAHEAATHDWIMSLDADEVVPPTLADRLRRIAVNDEADIVIIPFLNFMIGRPLRHLGWESSMDRHHRFYKRESLKFSETIHSLPTMAKDARILELPAVDDLSVWHFNYTDWSHFLTKLNRYTSVEASNMLNRGEPPTIRWLLRRIAHEIAYRYFRRAGFKDGYRGFTLVSLMILYQILIYAKTRQYREVGQESDILKKYADIAEELHEKGSGQ